MSRGSLVIGTRRYSSWSMRGWLAVMLAGLDVAVEVIPLAGAAAGGTAAIRARVPSGKVPYLEHDGCRVWESLAICEYCAEQAPGLWPTAAADRAAARAVAAEMHAGFQALRQALPMNLGRDRPAAIAAPVRADIDRIEAVWHAARGGGRFLYSDTFGLADAMYAPVVARLLSYRPTLGEGAQAYCALVRAHGLVARWYDEAAQEPVAWRLPQYEDA